MECSHSWTPFSGGGRMVYSVDIIVYRKSIHTDRYPDFQSHHPRAPCREGAGHVPVRQGTCHHQHPGQPAEGRTPSFQGAEIEWLPGCLHLLCCSASSAWGALPGPATEENKLPHWWWWCTQQASVRKSGGCARSMKWRWSLRLDSHSAQCWPRWRTLYQWRRNPR